VPILNISAISVRLHDERLDLDEWQVQEFYRCLHKNEPLLERRVVATSPKGHTLEIKAQRLLMTTQKNVMQLRYTVRSMNYAGPITILSVLRGGEDADKWYSLMNYVGDDICWTWEQLQPMNVQVCSAMKYQLYHNDILVTQRPIKVEKQEVIGFSVTQKIEPGDTLLLCKNVSVVDSNHYAKDVLIDTAVRCLIN
jgi:maltose phosphorylase